MNQIAHHHAMTNILQLTICRLFSSKKIQLSCIIYDHAKNMKVPMFAMAREDTKLQRSRGGDHQLKILYTRTWCGLLCMVSSSVGLVWLVNIPAGCDIGYFLKLSYQSGPDIGYFLQLSYQSSHGIGSKTMVWGRYIVSVQTGNWCKASSTSGPY